MTSTYMAHTVHIRDSALQLIATEAARSCDGLETGGILLGSNTKNDQFRVLIAGDPGPAAIREPSRFLRDLHHAQTLANQAWKAERAQWIGEWHTHPGGQPVPSPFDMVSYLRHLGDPELGFTQFLSLIVAFPETGPPVVGAWRITKHGAQAVDIQVVTERD